MENEITLTQLFEIASINMEKFNEKENEFE